MQADLITRGADAGRNVEIGQEIIVDLAEQRPFLIIRGLGRAARRRQAGQGRDGAARNRNIGEVEILGEPDELAGAEDTDDPVDLIAEQALARRRGQPDFLAFLDRKSVV